MTRVTPSFASPTILVLAALSVSGVACGGTGNGDDDCAATGGTGATGSGGTGGGSGGMGTSGTSGGDPTPTQMYTFDSDEQGWVVQYTAAGILQTGEMATAISTADVEVAWSTGEGDGDDGGALKVSSPFATESQYVGIGLHLNQEDMTGKLVKARVKLVDGLGDPTELTSAPGGAKLYAKSGAEYVYAAGVFTNIDTVGKWLTLRFDLRDRLTWSYEDTADGKAFDPALVGEVGIQFDTGAQTTTARPAVELVDNVSW